MVIAKQLMKKINNLKYWENNKNTIIGQIIER